MEEVNEEVSLIQEYGHHSLRVATLVTKVKSQYDYITNELQEKDSVYLQETGHWNLRVIDQGDQNVREKNIEDKQEFIDLSGGGRGFLSLFWDPDKNSDI